MRFSTPRVPAASISAVPAAPTGGRQVTVYDSRGRAIDLRLSIRELRAAARAAGIPDGVGGDDPNDRDALERALVAHYHLEVPLPRPRIRPRIRGARGLLPPPSAPRARRPRASRVAGATVQAAGSRPPPNPIRSRAAWLLVVMAIGMWDRSVERGR
jgi:hypothetical protein